MCSLDWLHSQVPGAPPGLQSIHADTFKWLIGNLFISEYQVHVDTVNWSVRDTWNDDKCTYTALHTIVQTPPQPIGVGLIPVNRWIWIRSEGAALRTCYSLKKHKDNVTPSRSTILLWWCGSFVVCIIMQEKIRHCIFVAVVLCIYPSLECINACGEDL